MKLLCRLLHHKWILRRESASRQVTPTSEYSHYWRGWECERCGEKVTTVVHPLLVYDPQEAWEAGGSFRGWDPVLLGISRGDA